MENPFYIVDQNDQNNRFCYAKKDIKKGETLFCSNEPLGLATLKVSRQNTCQYCVKLDLSQTLKKCSACNSIYYCSQQCQKDDWKLHKQECKVLQQMIQKNIVCTSLFMLILRLYLQKDTLIDMFYTPQKIIDSSQEQFSLEIAYQILKYLKEEMTEVKISLLKKLFLIVNYNAFTIQTQLDSQQLAIGLYFGANFFNNSCTPNAIQIFDQKTLKIIAIKDIPQKEQILICYTDTVKPFGLRYQFFKDQYGFTCNCEKCCQDQLDQLSSKHEQLYSQLNELDNQIYQYLQKNEIDNAIQYLKKYIKIYKKLDTFGFNPTLGWKYCELNKCLFQQNQIQQSYQYGKQAIEILENFQTKSVLQEINLLKQRIDDAQTFITLHNQPQQIQNQIYLNEIK